MSYSDFDTEWSRSGARRGWNLLEALIDARAHAEQQFLADLRRNVDAGLKLAEEISRQGIEFRRSLIDQFSRALSTPGSAAGAPYDPHRASGPDASERVAEPAGWEDVAPRNAAPERPPALRLMLPRGTGDVGVPIQLRNRRDSTDVLSFTANPLHLDGAAIIPTEFIRFQPETLAIPPQEEGCVQLLLHLGHNLAPGIEYWSEIVITGADTKRIPLVVQILADA